MQFAAGLGRRRRAESFALTDPPKACTSPALEAARHLFAPNQLAVPSHPGRSARASKCTIRSSALTFALPSHRQDKRAETLCAEIAQKIGHLTRGFVAIRIDSRTRSARNHAPHGIMRENRNGNSASNTITSVKSTFQTRPQNRAPSCSNSAVTSV